MACTLISALQALSEKGYNIVSVGSVEYPIRQFIRMCDMGQPDMRVDYMEYRLWAEVYTEYDIERPIAIVKF